MPLPSLSWTDFQHGRASFLEAGKENEGTPVVLLHGGGLDCASLSWRLLFPELGKQHHVIAVNWPGYGGSEEFGRNYTISDLRLWLSDLMDALEIMCASLVGISMGGGAALSMAVHQPERVEKVIPVSTFGVAPRGPMHELTYLLTWLPLNRWSFAAMRRSPKLLDVALKQIFKDPSKVTPEISAEVQEVLSDSSNGEAFSGFQRGEMGFRRLHTVFTEHLPDIECSALFIHGDADALVPLSDVMTAAATMSNAELEVLSAGHWPTRECPEDFNRLVTAFLSK